VSTMYRRVMWGSGVIATLIILPYLALSCVAMSDGRQGFEMPAEVNIICAVAVEVAAVVAIAAWMLREIVTGEAMRAQLDSAVGRAYRGGMIQQAQAAVDTGKVRNIRTVTSADD
jgi:hypothetical protein